jgi:hypothetical protein
MKAITLFLVAVLAGLGVLFGVVGNLLSWVPREPNSPPAS